MLDDADDELDAPSRMSRLDLRGRLLAAVGAAFVFSAFRHLAPALGGLVLALGLAPWCGASLRRWPKRVLAANVFILFMGATLPLTTPGEAVARVGSLQWSREGLALALLIAVKSNAILLCFLALTTGAGLSMIGAALERLRVPAKLVFLFLFTGRYIHVIDGEWKRLQTAARLRGFVLRNSAHTYRTIAHMLGLTFVNGIDRARRVYEAMELRGFAGNFHTVTEFRAGRADRLFGALFFAALFGLLGLDWLWA